MDMSMEGAVFVQTNAAHNEVIAFSRAADGSLTRAGEFATGGAGDGNAHLPSQGSVTLTRDRRHLLVTNVASNDVSVFAVNGAVQMAYADAVTRDPRCESVTAFYQRKRDLFLRLMEGSRFRPLSSQGTFFQLFDYSAITDDRDVDVAVRLIKEHGVAAIPLSPFLLSGELPGPVLRFCFAKRDETLEKAAERLRAM